MLHCNYKACQPRNTKRFMKGLLGTMNDLFDVISRRQILALAPDINKIRETSIYQKAEHDCTSCAPPTKIPVYLCRQQWAHYATSPAFLLTNQTAFLHVKPEHLMTNSADKNKKPGPQRRDSSAACWQDWSICFCTCNILQQISIWGFATMSCWAMNSVESELYIFMCKSIYFFVIVCLLDISGLDRKCDAAEIKTTYRKSPVGRIWNSIPFSVKNSMFFFRMFLLSFLFCDRLLSVLSYFDHSVLASRFDT